MRAAILASLLLVIAVAIDGAEPKPVPPLRSRAEVEAILAKSVPRGASTNRPLNIVLVASKQDHGPGEHDYPAWQTNWVRLLSQADAITVESAWKWPSAEQLEKADLLIFYFWGHEWGPALFSQLEAYQARGGGILLFHSACIADQDPEALSERIGLASQPKRSKYRHGELDLHIVAPANFLTVGLPATIHFLDETYWPMFGDTNRVEVLATAEEEGKSWPMVWTCVRGKGRLFGTILGHYSWTYDDPFYRILVLRAAAWAVREPISRFEPLATVGVQFKN
jgi:hypothetical protein